MSKSILFMVTKSIEGGAQQWVIDQVGLFHGKAQIHLLTSREGWLTSKLPDSVKVDTDIRVERFFSFPFVIALATFLRRRNVDVVVASSANAGFYARVACFLSGTRVVYVSHGWSSVYSSSKLRKFFIAVERALARVTDSVLCVSESDRVVAEETIRIPPHKIRLILNGVHEHPRWEGRISSLPKVVMVARFEHPKRQDLLIQALHSSPVEVYLVGASKQQADPLWLTYRNIHFCGTVQDFTDYANFDIFCLISDSEGLPLAALEAMSAGLPLVLSNVGGCKELICGNGVLVSNSLEDIANAVELCIRNHSEFSQKSRLLFEQKFSLDSKVGMYFETYFGR